MNRAKHNESDASKAETRHLYEYSVDLASHTAPSYVVQLVGSAKRVLEIGCGPGSITKLLTQQNQCQVTGIEVDPVAIGKVAPYCETIIQADLNNPEWPNLLAGKTPFDVIVAADVLEHLYDPWTVLREMACLINKEGYLVISLPHVGHAAVAGCLANGDFQYHNWGLLDRTHIRFFCLKNIQELFAQADLKIIDVRYVIRSPEETEFASSWRSLPVRLQDALKSYKYSNIYQVVIKAVPIGHPGAAIFLQQAFERGNFSHVTPLKTRIRTGIASCLNIKIKQRIRALFGFFKIRL